MTENVTDSSLGSRSSEGVGTNKARERVFETFSRAYSKDLAFWNREHDAHEKDPKYRTFYKGIWWDRLQVQEQLGIAFADVITRQVDLGDPALLASWYTSYRMDLCYLNNPG